VSLSSHLDAAASPVCAFFAERLPATGPVVRAASLRLRAGRPSPSLPAGEGVNPVA
jgi:hypothetical protein